MLKKTISLAVFTLLFLSGICSMGIAADNESDFVKLKAKIMAIDLINDRAIIAEKEFKLMFHYDENFEKVWDTRFLDNEGNQITPDQIKKRDRVLVRGKKDNGTIIALEIILLE
ncbi:hypothetical protein [Desulfobacter latus]|uniref:DUF5666 domain-containing protein n=1 Tax=Desulfobacter latus TaxID=2292 RepID=A0A850T6H1_9BACT|nr:hypothetical protein [Desulfobacter latus]NWH06701.1 hypothetical protein [Desulfobacter latus]